MSKTSIYYLIINPEQSQPLNVVDMCLKHFSDIIEREPGYHNYDLLISFFQNGVCSFLEGDKEDLEIVKLNLEENEINCDIIESLEFDKKIAEANEIFKNKKTIKISFADQEFDANPTVSDLSIIDTDEYDDYTIKVWKAPMPEFKS